MSEPLEKRYLRVESPSGDTVYGSFVIGVPVETVLQLKQKYPDRQFSGSDPRVDKAIKTAITEDEKLQIGRRLSIGPNTQFKIEFHPIGLFIDEAKQPAHFESNGKKFWIIPYSP
jgi:hypothetical protein